MILDIFILIASFFVLFASAIFFYTKGLKREVRARYLYRNGVMTVIYPNGKKDKFKGESTVWYKLPEMKRCGTFTERWLSEKYQSALFQKKSKEPDEKEIDNATLKISEKSLEEDWENEGDIWNNY